MNILEHYMNKRELNKQDRSLLDTCNQMGFGEIELPVYDGFFDMDAATICEHSDLDKPLWVARKCSEGSEISERQTRCLDKIRSTTGEVVLTVKVASGEPCRIQTRKSPLHVRK